VAILLHRHGALALFDYAAAGPYLPIDMNPAAPWGQGAPAYKDAVFISPHKFRGGPGTPGVLVAKRASCCGAPWPRRTSLAGRLLRLRTPARTMSGNAVADVIVLVLVGAAAFSTGWVWRDATRGACRDARR
jgi:hypothetical protein